jgi:hypothetical protein
MYTIFGLVDLSSAVADIKRGKAKAASPLPAALKNSRLFM